MTSLIQKLRPPDGESLRRAIYEGVVYQLPPTNASQTLAERVSGLLREELGAGEEDVRTVAARLDDADFFARIGRIRKIIYLEREFHDSVRDVVAACGFDPQEVAFDPLRLRVVADRGHENPRARAVYYAHRDTWYAHSQSLIAWWIPLDSLAEEETFYFYPDRFGAAVPNDSEIFDYDAWVKDGWSLKIGWQDRDAGLKAKYPGVVGEVDPGRAVGFACRRAENLLFSGAHFHQTRAHALGRTRFSLDFRVVHLADHRRGIGAPNADNRSRGSAIVDYVQPGSGT